MRFGCCLDATAGLEKIAQLAEIGYDYVELSLAPLAVMPEAEFQPLAAAIGRAGLPCEACNVFYPRHVRLTGDDVNWPQVQEYTQRAIARAAQLGAQIIVFGSAGAKNVPDGFPAGRAWAQIVETLRMADPWAAAHGITIAIEPLNRRESNIVQTAAEGLALAREVDRPQIKLLVDYYHLALEEESPAILLEAAEAVRHIHIAQVESRAFPTTVQEGYQAFFANLKAIGYAGRVSVEARTTDFADDAALAFRVLKQLATIAV